MTSLARNIGASIFIAISGSLVARNIQVSHADLAQHITPFKQQFLQPEFMENTPNGSAALAMIEAELNRQAAMVAYVDVFWLTMWMAILALPLVFLLSKTDQIAKADMTIIE